MAKTKLINWNGTNAVEMQAAGYTAIIAYELGSNCIRLYDNDKGIEFFRYKDQPAENIRQSAEVWGLPTLYLPNRFRDGIVKTSDGEYNLPVNIPPPENTHLHGFLHKRVHKLVAHGAAENEAFVKTSYIFDENDEMFGCFPIAFTAEYTFKLSQNGLDYSVTFTNNSDKAMPISMATHTAMNSPFVDNSSEDDQTISANIGKKCLLDERNLPSLEFIELDEYDKQYVNGTMKPTLHNINNDMYYAEKNAAGEIAVVLKDRKSGKGIKYTVGDMYKFWIFWNDNGTNGYFCPEPMTGMIDCPNINHPDSGYIEIKNAETFTVTQNFKSI
ncbi:MAG: aldose 1-epimerase [Oscillospiraceae bacterium]|jgi:aldose 1-epimerase|nr:aldose 1-epimerase [Oscillospiraceae bacterium]